MNYLGASIFNELVRNVFVDAFMEDKLTRKLLDKHCGRHEFESENSHSENETVVFNHKSDKTSTEHTSGVAISNFRNLVNVYRTAEKNGFIVDRKPPQDDQENSDTECESYNESQDHKRRVVLRKPIQAKAILVFSVNPSTRHVVRICMKGIRYLIRDLHALSSSLFLCGMGYR